MADVWTKATAGPGDATYKGRRIWIYPYHTTSGWNVKVDVWKVEQGAVSSDQLTLPANMCFATSWAAQRYAEGAVKRWIDRH